MQQAPTNEQTSATTEPVIPTPIVVASAATTPKKAAVIDDAFDDVLEGEIPFENFVEFRQEVDQNETYALALARLNISQINTLDFDGDSEEYITHLKTLWANRSDTELISLINHDKLFHDKLDKLSQLEDLCTKIESHNITVQKIPSTTSNFEFFASGEYVYIFIDYRLGHKADQASIEHAKKVVKDIYDRCPNDKKPVTILMSTEPSIETHKEAFRKEANMLEGVFRVSPKADLRDQNKISLLIKAYGEEFYSNHVLQDYIQSLMDSSKQAQEDFASDIKRLNVEDYEFMQHSVLQEDGQPLGDYLAWLYGSRWSSLLHKNPKLKEKQKELDKVISQKAPLHHSAPSPKISDILMSVLFEEDLGNIESHPWQGLDGKIANLPYLHLGDLFTKSGNSYIFMIINPQCDLERPSEENKDISVYVIQGELEKIESAPQKRGPKTDFFVFEENRYRIVWDFKRVKTIALMEFETWQKANNLERKYRLKPLFAIEVQQKFTSNLSRVGLPVSPPLSRQLSMKIHYKNWNDEIEKDFLPKSDDYAFLPITKDAKNDRQVRLTLKFALAFKEKLGEEIERLKKIPVDESKKNKPLSEHITKLVKILSGFDDWFFEKRGFPYPNEKDQKEILSKALASTLDATEFIAKTPFLINILVKKETALQFVPADEEKNNLSGEEPVGPSDTSDTKPVVEKKSEEKSPDSSNLKQESATETE